MNLTGMHDGGPTTQYSPDKGNRLIYRYCLDSPQGRNITQGMNSHTASASNKRHLEETEDFPTKKRETSMARNGLQPLPKDNASLTR